MFRKILSMLMVVAVVASMLSVSVFATEAGETSSVDAATPVEVSEEALSLWNEVKNDMVVPEKVMEDDVPEELRQKAKAMFQGMAAGAEGRDVGDYYFYEREDNSTWANADRVYHDYTIVAEIDYSVDLDYYKFTLSSSCYTQVAGVSETYGMGMLIYESSNSDDAIGSSLFSYSDGLYVGSLHGTISSGTYYICVLNINQYAGDYMLYLDATAASSGGNDGGGSSGSGGSGGSGGSSGGTTTLGIPTIDVSASAAGVTVGWSVTAGADSYKVYRSTNGRDWSEVCRIYTSGMGNWTDDSVKHGKEYYYAVSAVSSNGNEGGKSPAYYVYYTLLTPNGVKASATETGIRVTWDEVPLATRYAVYRSVDGGAYSWVAAASFNFYNDTAVVDGKRYSYKIACYNPDGTGIGGQSGAASATCVKPDHSLPAPGGIVAAQSGTAIEVTWNAVSGASRYAVYRSINGGAYNWVAGVYTNSYTDTKMTDGSTYSYKIACYNTSGSGCGSQSVAASATYKKPVTKLPAPTGLSTESTEEGLKLTWIAVPNAERYAVYMSTDGVNYKWLSGPYTNSYVDTAIKDGETRFYKVACYNLGASGVGAYSSVAWGTYKAPEVELIVPAKPYNIVNVVSGVHVYWKATAGADKYGLWRSETGRNGTYKWVANPTVPHFTDTKVESGKTYFYKVTSMDVQTNTHSDRSEPIGIAYTYTPDITSRENTAQGMKLGWQKIDGATGYAIYRKTYSGGDDWVRITTIDGVDVLSWTDTSVADKNGDVYKYTIRALHGTTLSGCRAAGRTVARVSSVNLGGANKAGADSVMTFWTKNEKATGYEIRFVSNGVTVKTEKVPGAESMVKTVTGLASGKTYSVQVRAYITVEGVGSFYSDWSATKTVTL